MPSAQPPSVSSQLIDRMEAEYRRLVAFGVEHGASPEHAHEHALKVTLRIQGEALAELRGMGQFPWRDVAEGGEGSHG